MADEITSAVADLDMDRASRVLGEAVAAGKPAMEILDALKEAAAEIGRRFEEGRYFVSDLIIAGQILKNAFDLLKPHLKLSGVREEGRVVLGTIEGDMHDIGKAIVSALLQSSGFEVYDLGVDVPAKKFVDAAKEKSAGVIGVSVLYSGASLNIRGVVEELEKAGLRGRVKVIMGGAAANEEFIKSFGIDAAVTDAVEGINIIRSWLTVKPMV